MSVRNRQLIIVVLSTCCLLFAYTSLKRHLNWGNSSYALQQQQQHYVVEDVNQLAACPPCITACPLCPLQECPPCTQQECPQCVQCAPCANDAVNAPSTGVMAVATVKRKKWIIGVTVAGGNPYYGASVARVVKGYARVMPAWTVRICYDDTTPQAVLDSARAAVPPGGNAVEFLHARDIRKRLNLPDGPEPPNFMVWRFVSAFEDDVERTIPRDSDSMPLMREAMAIQEWIDSGLKFHLMRDHPWHNVAILGGMWGAMDGFIPRSVLDSMMTLPNAKGKDQEWLSDFVWQPVRSSVMVHDAYYCKVSTWSGVGEGSKTRPFPSLRPSLMHHIGGYYDGVANNFVGLDMDTRMFGAPSDPSACCRVQPAPVIGKCVCCRDFADNEEI